MHVHGEGWRERARDSARRVGRDRVASFVDGALLVLPWQDLAILVALPPTRKTLHPPPACLVSPPPKGLSFIPKAERVKGKGWRGMARGAAV
jgi:hypothetical protein